MVGTVQNVGYKYNIQLLELYKLNCRLRVCERVCSGKYFDLE